MMRNNGWLLLLALVFVGCGPESGDPTVAEVGGAVECRLPRFHHNRLPACTYTYTAWGDCQPDGSQLRAVVSSTPKRCTGTPVLSQACTYVPPESEASVAWSLTDPGTGTVVPITEASMRDNAYVFIVTDWPAAGATRVYVAIMSPSGSMYYGTYIPFDAPNGSIITTYTLADGRHRVVERLLIWGTTIEMYAETGDWIAWVREPDYQGAPEVKATLTLY